MLQALRPLSPSPKGLRKRPLPLPTVDGADALQLLEESPHQQLVPPVLAKERSLDFGEGFLQTASFEDDGVETVFEELQVGRPFGEGPELPLLPFLVLEDPEVVGDPEGFAENLLHHRLHQVLQLLLPLVLADLVQAVLDHPREPLEKHPQQLPLFLAHALPPLLHAVEGELALRAPPPLFLRERVSF